MEHLIVLGLAVAVLLSAAASALPNRPPPPQIIYVQAPPVEPGGTGRLPLLILVGIVLAALAFV